MRRQLTALQEADALARRKELYEALHPQTRRGGDRKSTDAESKRNDFVLIPSFAANIAALGVTERTVQTGVQIATGIGEEARAIGEQAPAPEQTSGAGAGRSGSA